MGAEVVKIRAKTITISWQVLPSLYKRIHPQHSPLVNSKTRDELPTFSTSNKALHRPSEESGEGFVSP